MTDRPETPAERFQLALDLLDLSVAMLRQRCQREGLSEAETEAAIDAWFAHRPGAEHGDCEGTPVSWPRRP